MLTSKEVLDKTGISRATLNNYISSGVVPKPDVLPPGPQHGDAPRIGYFPDEVLARIAEIQRLKAEGWSMQRIADHFSPAPSSASPVRVAQADPQRLAAAEPHSPQPASPGPVLRSPGSSPDRNAGPRLTAVAVLATNLEHSRRTWQELPPNEYFELVNQVWFETDPIVRKHHGVHGNHACDGMICYFFPQPNSNYLWNSVAAALEIREAMRRISKDWQLRKGWETELVLNSGISEGEEWLGTMKSFAQPEFTGLARTIKHASRICELARGGAVWVSKNFMARLTPGERAKLKYGVHRKNSAGTEVLIPSIFSRHQPDPAACSSKEFMDSGLPPLTQVIESSPDRDNR